MARAMCLQLLVVLPACLKAMVLLSPPDLDEPSVKSELYRLAAMEEGEVEDWTRYDDWTPLSPRVSALHRPPTLPFDRDAAPDLEGRLSDSAEDEPEAESWRDGDSLPTRETGASAGHFSSSWNSLVDDDDDNDDDDDEALLLLPAEQSSPFKAEGAFEENDLSDDTGSDEDDDTGSDDDYFGYTSTQKSDADNWPSEDTALEQVQREDSEPDTTGLDDLESILLPDPVRPSQRSRRSTRRRSRPASQAERAERARYREQRRRWREKRKRARIAGRRHGGVIKAQVELLVVVENSIFRKYLANNYNNRQAALARIRRYYGIVVAMMDERFQTIEDRRLSISVSISGILIAESREDSAWLEKLADWSNVAQNNGRATVNTDQALLDFSRWIRDNHKDLPKFDHAMVFSGYRLSNKYGGSFGGKAYLNAICDIEHGNSVSIVSDRGDFQCVKVATHELAHSLGSVHDGDPGFESCPSDGNYVMAPVATNKLDRLRNAFFFSRCSVKQMKKLLRSKKAACVRDTPTVFYKYDLQRMPPGKIISLDQHCQLIYGPKATFCNEGDVEVVCGQLWCRDPNERHGACRTNSYLTALPGTPCGQGKSCHLGECQANSVIQDLTSRANRRRHPTRTPSPTSSTTSPTGPSRVLVPGSSQSRLSGGQRDLDNTIPTVPQSMIRGRVGRPSKARREQLRRRHRFRSGRGRSRPRNKSRRKGRCRENQPDINVEYCRGLVTVNPGACKRRAINNYCCRTCAFRR